MPATRRLRLEVKGAVQGVGFRPFVYRLAREMDLAGWVGNDAEGVCIEVEGGDEALHTFVDRLSAEKPREGSIHDIGKAWLDPLGYASFEIRPSRLDGDLRAVVQADLATCDACLREVLAPDNRRHRYPFTNCTDCGPRFTIVEQLPYDRPHTTMRGFEMCRTCRAEYEDPADRRFHAEPNACPDCGPRIELWDRDGAVHARGDAALLRVAKALRRGATVAVKGLGGFHLMVDAADARAVARLREAKPRKDKPFALMVRDVDMARELCEVSDEAERMLRAREAPIVLLPRRDGAPVAPNVAPGVPDLGVMLPATPLHHLLLRETARPLVATSGNLAEEPICTGNHEALGRLGGVAEHFLVHDRPVARHVDDSVAWIHDGAPRLLRRARGHAPLPVRVEPDLPPILAVGAHLKNTVALGLGHNVFLSQHIGDLETPEALAAFQQVIGDFMRLYDARPVAVAHDMHPDYLSTTWVKGNATRLGEARLVAVQHHHAHLVACLADNGCTKTALGATWDGTGYGPDGTVWGGEFLVGNARACRRVAHFLPFRLPGGEAAVREPRRSALGLLFELGGEAALLEDDLPPLRSFPESERLLVGRMLRSGTNAPVTSSAGRLFDGVAALLGLHLRTSYEGQAARTLEHIACADAEHPYPLPLVETQPCPVLDWRPLVREVVDDYRRGVRPGLIAALFHNALVEALVEVARAAGEERVALSGGCFQNRRLAGGAARRLKEEGFEVLLHRQVPPNDGGLSLGQVLVAAAALEGGDVPGNPGAHRAD